MMCKEYQLLIFHDQHFDFNACMNIILIIAIMKYWMVKTVTMLRMMSLTELLIGNTRYTMIWHNTCVCDRNFGVTMLQLSGRQECYLCIPSVSFVTCIRLILSARLHVSWQFCLGRPGRQQLIVGYGAERYWNSTTMMGSYNWIQQRGTAGWYVVRKESK